MRSYKITANLMNKNNIADKTFQQYDYGNKIEFELLEGAQKIDLTGKTILTYWLKNGSTVPIEKSATVNSNGNIEVKTTQELLEVSGELLMQILVSSNDEQARSQVFKFNVEKSLNGDNAIIEDPNYSSDLVAELIQLKNNVRAETIDKIIAVENIVNTKMDKNAVLTMDNMGQDIKEAMVGGSVAVVGENCVDVSNFTTNLQQKFTQMNFDLSDITERYVNSSYNKLEHIIDSTTSFISSLKGAIKLTKAINNTVNDIGTLRISNLSKSISLELLPNEYLDIAEKCIYRYWDKKNFSDLSIDNITFQSNDTNAIIKFTDFDISNYDCTVTTQNIISTSSKFVGECQLNYATIKETKPFIGTKSDEASGVKDNYLCLSILKADVTNAGYTWNTSGIKSYLNSLDDFEFYIRRSAKYAEAFYTLCLFVEKSEIVNVLSSNIEFEALHYLEDNENMVDNIFGDSECIYYQAIVKKPFNSTFENVPIGIKVKFKKGECISTKCIEVYKQIEVPREGSTTLGEMTFKFTKLDMQFEDDITPHDNINIGKYSDGSIQSGTIWIKDTLSTENIYFIKVYDKIIENDYTQIIVPTNDSTEVEVKYTNSDVKYLFNRYMGYNLRSIYIGNKCINDSNLAFRPSIRNNSLSDINLNGKTATNTSFEIKGDGVIFMDFIAKNVFNYNENIESITHYRFWYNGQLDIKSIIQTNEEISSNELTGVNFKFLWDGVSGDAPTKLEVGTVYDDYNKCLGILKSIEFSPEYPDKNSYTSSLAVGYDSSSSVYARRIYAMWKNENFTIPKGSKFGVYDIFKHDSNLTSTNAKEESWKMLNTIYTRATKLNKEELKTNLKSKLLTFLEYMLDKVNNTPYKETGHTLFPGAEVFLYIAYMKTHNIDLWDKLESSKDYLFNTRWGGVTTGDELYNRWKNKTNSYVGIEWFGRDSAMLPYLYEAYKEKGDNTKANEVLTMLEASADLFVNIENHYGADGTLCLTVDETRCNTNAQSAGFKCLIKAIELMPDNSKVATWTTVKDRILTKYISLIRYGTIIPHNEGNDSSTFQPQFHYEAFPSMDYVISVDSLEYNPQARLYEGVTPNGSCKEFHYNYHRKRKGFVHTLLYCASTHALIGDISGLEEANQIMDFIISRCYPNGYHQYPLDGWGNEDSSYANFPIECQVVSELLFELEG